MITGIVVALPNELSTLTQQKFSRGCCSFLSENIVIACSGAGPKNAHAAAELLLAQGANRLISWGCAAALRDSLDPGRLTLVGSIASANDERIDIRSPWLTACQTLLSSLSPLTSGYLLESTSLVSTAQAKKNLQENTGASVLDMESFAIAKFAKAQHLPFLAIRAIADPADMDLPAAIAYSLNDEGDVVMPKLLGYLMRHPSELKGLIQLGLHFRAAQKTLQKVATSLTDICHTNS